jgi:hypothetical protein
MKPSCGFSLLKVDAYVVALPKKTNMAQAFASTRRAGGQD